ncbi:FimV/HubP family polar landmark protein [Fontimonas thermophila]|nr:FimV/HubP family polar landmark protein [Fontimonas thermophila]
MSAAAALGLGDIDVRSRLNQRFSATIPLTSTSAAELQTLKIGLASNAEFAKAGIERPAYLSSLKFEVKTDGVPRIEITSDQPAREPFLTLLLEVSSGGNRLLREYTVFLDPPDYTAPEAAAVTFYETAAEAAAKAERGVPPPEVRSSAPASAKTMQPDQAQPRAAPAPIPQEPVVAGSQYGPVRAAETLWSIATRLRPPSATMDQVLLALYRTNPQAFDGGIDGLLKGAMLKVPSAEAITALDPAEARAEVQRLRGVPKPAATAAVVPRRPPAVPEPVHAAPVAEPAPAAATLSVPAPAASNAPPPEPPAAEEPASVMPTEPVSSTNSAAVAASSAPQTSETAQPVAEAAASPAPQAATPAAQDDTPPASEPPQEESLNSGTSAARESGLIETLLLPLIGGLLIVGALGYLLSRVLARRRAGGQAAPSPARNAPVHKPAVVPRPAAAASAAAAAAPAARSVEEEIQALQEALDQEEAAQTQRTGLQPAATQQIRTQQLHPQPAATPPSAAVPAGVPADSAGAATEAVDFDLTGQFEAQTVQINLDANDPVSEADFHLAYGLYDEAALLLRQAAEKEPHRADIRLKLLETYFAAGRKAEFQEAAAAARALLSAADWQKVTIMGQQLAPDSPLFGEPAGVAAEASVDLDLGSPAEPADAAEPARAAEPVLDFRLDEFDAPKLDEPKLDLATTDKAEMLEFDLSQFDLAEPAAAAPAAGRDEARSLDFDLDTISLDTEPPKPQSAEVAAPQRPLDEALAAEVADIKLDDIDLADMPIEGGGAVGDETSTKLDLARAYVDMGDNEMARALLDEVVQHGNAQQKQQAQALIARLA